VAHSTKSSAVETKTASTPRLWHKPELRRLLAGAAEAAGHAGNDGTTNQS
jgi:hypothetical protein